MVLLAEDQDCRGLLEPVEEQAVRGTVDRLDHARAPFGPASGAAEGADAPLVEGAAVRPGINH